jgi:hypothetical protein
MDLELEEGGLRHVRLGDREILRRIYVAVRDAQWATIPIRISHLKIEEPPGGFLVTFDASHREGPIDFAWSASLRGDGAGVTFRMEGEARRSFSRNRIGICVLHPIEECAGRPCRIEQDSGVVQEGVFPRQISPHQPFFDIRAISHEAAPGLRARVSFEGDVFEMEDQRNWSDASYKTYSTPLRLPRPVEIAAGTTIVQQVTLAIEGPTPGPPVARAADPVALRVEPGQRSPLPRLGTALIRGHEMLDAFLM